VNTARNSKCVFVVWSKDVAINIITRHLTLLQSPSSLHCRVICFSQSTDSNQTLPKTS